MTVNILLNPEVICTFSRKLRYNPDIPIPRTMAKMDMNPSSSTLSLTLL